MVTQHNHTRPDRGVRTSRSLLYLLLAFGAIYLLIWHTVHLAVAVPYLLLLSCPLMYLFMDGRHGGHGGHGGHESDER